jgi:molybdopterin biosynthesis enzyme
MVADSELQRIARLTPLADVLASFDIGVVAVDPRETTVAAAVGRTLAADVAAPAGRPSAPLALRDGFALRAELTTDASTYAPAPLSPAPPGSKPGRRRRTRRRGGGAEGNRAWRVALPP